MFMPGCGKYFSALVASHKADMANGASLLGINTGWRFAISGDKQLRKHWSFDCYHIVFIDSSLCDTNHTVFAKPAETQFD